MTGSAGHRITFLTGPPGCGKTTAIRRIARGLDVPAGAVMMTCIAGVELHAA